MKKPFRTLKHVVVFLFLTIISQVGGIVYLLSVAIANRINISFRLKRLIVFIPLYLIFTFLLVPFIAPMFGREKVVNSSSIKPVSYYTVFLNRNYVTPELNTLLLNVSEKLNNQNSGIQVRYLDACFPFINGFPLLPHFSHNDGKKIDLSLVYENSKGEVVNKSKSNSGYGVFVSPKPGEMDHTRFAKSKGYIQYDYPKYLTFGKINKELRFSKKGTKLLLKVLLEQDNLGKIFIEPNLNKRMNLSDKRIRFQGYSSVRHDDHIHIQLK